MTTPAQRRAAEKYRKSAKGKATKRRWKKKHIEKIRRWKREWASSANGKESARMYYRKSPKATYQLYRASAKRRGLAFDLDEQEFAELIGRPCSYCGAEHQRNGLDRVDNTVGYTKNNVVPCCMACNQMKGKRTTMEFLHHVCSIVVYQETIGAFES